MVSEAAAQRLSKFLAACGVASRRHCEEIINAGRVTVNGQVVLLPQHHVSAADKVTVDGQPVKAADEKVYYLLNKPRGYLCSNERGNHKKIVLDLLPADGRLFTVGRLDKDTEGLLIITNDGHFANKVIHPSSNIAREYLVKVHEEIDDRHLKAIGKGTLVEGSLVQPHRVVKVRHGTLRITVYEGKKHEVRQLVTAAGLHIRQLVRIRLGGLLLGKLPTGAWRPLGDGERMALFG